MNNNYPIRNNVYTLEQITKLYLRDSPALLVEHNSAVQESHLTEQQLLSVPGIKDSKWKYIRETHEWIPIFNYCSDEPWQTYFDSEPYVGGFGSQANALWVTPKGFPRAQDS